MSDLVGNPEDRFSRVAAQILFQSSVFVSSKLFQSVGMNQSVSRARTGVHRKTTYEPVHEKINNLGFRSDTNQAVQSQKQARSLKFRI